MFSGYLDYITDFLHDNLYRTTAKYEKRATVQTLPDSVEHSDDVLLSNAKNR